MNQFIDISDRKYLYNLLSALNAGTKPLWGKMNAQQMVEHLVQQIEYCNGKKITTCDLPTEEAAREKEKWIYTDIEIPKNLVLGPLPELRYSNLETAISQLLEELNDFEEYFKVPGITSIHAGYGAMNYHEWLIWHGKHFTHHFRQFGLLS
jgi:oxepin-CoA hydrolase/3-oxo-5,6-dehydrosuberyl-CoA semialdehyde dehydrogenase